MYCKAGEKPKVIYKFSNVLERTYESSVSPIEVRVDEGTLENFKGGQCPIWYGVKWRRPGWPQHEWYVDTIHSSGALGPLSFFRLVHGEAFGRGAWFFHFGCRAGDDIGYSNGFGSMFANYDIYGKPDNIELRPYLSYNQFPDWPRDAQGNALDVCGDPKPNCDLIITHNGREIFSDRGNCPVSYQVACTDCLPGQIKCITDGYPGYCCIDCDSTAQKILAIANKINGGLQ